MKLVECYSVMTDSISGKEAKDTEAEIIEPFLKVEYDVEKVVEYMSINYPKLKYLDDYSIIEGTIEVDDRGKYSNFKPR